MRKSGFTYENHIYLKTQASFGDTQAFFQICPLKNCCRLHNHKFTPYKSDPADNPTMNILKLLFVFDLIVFFYPKIKVLIRF